MKLLIHILRTTILPRTSILLFLLIMVQVTRAEYVKPAENNILILEVRGLTFEMLERAYAPNLKFLIKNGFLGGIEYRDPSDIASATRPRSNIRRKLGKMVACYDSLALFQSSLNTVGIYNDTIKGAFNVYRKNFRSNESMVKDFINSNNGFGVRFSFLSFRTFSPKANYLDRDQINELSTIDSLIGIVFKSYQEKVKWDKTTVIVLTDGNAAHKYSETEIYKQTPIIIKGPSIPEFQEPNNIIAIDDVLSLIGDILNVNCNDSIIPISKNIFTSADSSINNSIKKEFFVSRPDILIYPVLNRNQIDIELLADNESANLYYTINGDDPKTNVILYKDLIQIKEAGVFLIKAVTKYNSEWSSVTVQKAVLRNNLQSIEADPMPDPKYTFDGLDELVDLDTGNLSYAEDKWLGFQGKDVVFTFNFGAKRIINSIDISALQDYDSWIFLPNKITIFVGDDKSKMFEVGSVTHVSLKTDQRNIKKHFVIPITSDFLAKLSSTYIKKKRRQKSLYVKYLTVKIEANKTAPEWFTLPGAQTWFFTDEIKIE